MPYRGVRGSDSETMERGLRWIQINLTLPGDRVKRVGSRGRFRVAREGKQTHMRFLPCSRLPLRMWPSHGPADPCSFQSNSIHVSINTPPWRSKSWIFLHKSIKANLKPWGNPNSYWPLKPLQTLTGSSLMTVAWKIHTLLHTCWRPNFPKSCCFYSFLYQMKNLTSIYHYTKK
jgi:hypothetical protein